MTSTSRTSNPAAAGPFSVEVRHPTAAGETSGFPRLDASFTATLSPEASRVLTDLVYLHSRIRLGPDKQPMLANRLRRRLRALGLASFDEYCARLQSSPGPDEVEHLVDLIATNHTGFFREPDHFAFLTERMLPALVPSLVATGESLRAWSAAASSGEEPYTLAMVLADFLCAFPSVAWQIEASDISRRMLEQAQTGIYRLDARHTLAPELLRRHFQRGVGIRAGSCRVKPDLRKHVRFQRINLFQPEYPIPREQHVIFCRNVMMYFDPASRELLVHKLTRHLARGGYLVIGHSESLLGVRHDLEPVRQSIFRKP